MAIALGNIGDPIAVPALIEALADPDPVIRGHSAWALGRIGTVEARHGLETALLRESDGGVIHEIAQAADFCA